MFDKCFYKCIIYIYILIIVISVYKIYYIHVQCLSLDQWTFLSFS